MSSQLDLDQGGTYRETQKVYLGPSVGWVEISSQWMLNILAAGTTNILLGTNLILVNFNGSVTVQLPQFKATAAGAQAIPKQFATIPVVIVDVGGFAGAHPITILPFGTELISGLASIQITAPRGAYVIQPDIVNGGGNLIQ